MDINAANLHKLADRALRLVENKPRAVILLAGVPGSGKSTITSKVVQLLNDKVKAAVLPQDGYHFYRAELAKFPDPHEAFERRGAPFTFNAERFVQTVGALRSDAVVKAPSFDHSKKDPVEDDIVIYPDVQVVFVEGNYVLLKDEPWAQLRHLADETWFVTGDDNTILSRLVERHLAAGISSNREEAVKRAGGSDKLNADYIQHHSFPPDVTIHN